MDAVGSTSTSTNTTYSFERLLNNAMIASNASPNDNNPGEYDVDLSLIVDWNTSEGKQLLTLLSKMGVFFPKGFPS